MQIKLLMIITVENSSITDKVFCIHQRLEKNRRMGQFNPTIDFEKACESVMAVMPFLPLNSTYSKAVFYTRDTYLKIFHNSKTIL
jgi:hypothetical protein